LLMGTLRVETNQYFGIIPGARNMCIGVAVCCFARSK
jgi:hypothetical protein